MFVWQCVTLTQNFRLSVYRNLPLKSIPTERFLQIAQKSDALKRPQSKKCADKKEKRAKTRFLAKKYETIKNRKNFVENSAQ
jgi:hypothetical protein